MTKPDHAERIERTLRKAGLKRSLKLGDTAAAGGGIEFSWEGVEWKNPLSELMEAEERGVASACERAADVFDVESPENLRRIRALVFDQFVQFEAAFVAWLFDAGPHPVEVVKRLFAYTKYRRPDLLGDMAFRALGDLLNERGATMQARCKALFGELPAPWKKTKEAREHMSESARGNCNRLGGKKHLPPAKKSLPKKHKTKTKK